MGGAPYEQVIHGSIGGYIQTGYVLRAGPAIFQVAAQFWVGERETFDLRAGGGTWHRSTDDLKGVGFFIGFGGAWK